MVVPDEVRKSVVFLLYNGANEIKLAGTAFFASVEIDKKKNLSYLITARHVIEGVKKRGSDQKVTIRINLAAEGTKLVISDLDQWKYHPTDPSVDVAVLPFSPPQNEYDYLSIPTSMAAIDEVIREEGIGIGDEVFLTGLFYKHSGKERNLPILRVGNIAMMPAEKIPTRDLGNIEAYLVEARSIGGLSGSPVFVYLGHMRPKNGSVALGGQRNLFYWLGLMHGHWDIDKNRIDFAVDNPQENQLNTGIAVVVPVSKILETLNQEEFIKARKKIARELKKQNSPKAKKAA